MGGWDTSELDALARDLGRAPDRAERQVGKVMKKSALQVKRGMQKDFSRGGNSYAPAVKYSLEFEATGGPLDYKIGELDSDGPQWGLAAILSFGTSNNAPDVDHTAALHREAPLVVKYVGDAGESAVLGGTS